MSASEIKCKYCGGDLELVSPPQSFILRYTCKNPKCRKTSMQCKPSGLGELKIKGTKSEMIKRGIMQKEEKAEDV